MNATVLAAHLFLATPVRPSPTGTRMAVRSLLAVLLAVTVSGCIDTAATDLSSRDEADHAPLCTDACAVVVEGDATRSHESSVARNPLDPDQILVGASAWVRDETLDSCLMAGTPAETCPMFGPVELWRHVSFDGGTTWDSAPFPGDVPPDHPLAAPGLMADPIVAFLSDGTALYFGMYARGEPFDIFVARSYDGGLTWPDVAIVAGETTISMDQPFLAIGPDDTLLATWSWDHLEEASRRDVATAVSHDGGVTWSEPVLLTDRGAMGNSRPAITSDGTMYIAYRDRAAPHATPIWLARSDDGGATWDEWLVPGLRASEYVDLEAHGAALMMTYTEVDPAAKETTYVLRSEDGGHTWTSFDLGTSRWKSEPDRVGSIGPALAIGSDGTAYVLAYTMADDRRMNVVATRIGPDGTVAVHTLTDPPLGEHSYRGVLDLDWSIYGDYSGLYADEHGAVATWVGGEPDHPDLMMSLLEPASEETA